jgi:hypothetical protein
MKIEFDARRFGHDYILYLLSQEDCELFGYKHKYFITNGRLGLFGDNKKELIITMRTLMSK